jgi:hypothetical protein
MNKTLNRTLIVIISIIIIGLGGYILMHQIFYIPKMSGITSIKEITPTEFSQLKIWGPFNATIQQGDKNLIEIVADQNFQQCVLSQITENAVEISFNHKCNFIGLGYIPIQINITIQSLEKLEIAGAMELRGKWKIQLENNLELYISGASEATLTINANNIQGKISGASEANLNLETQQTNLRATWASELQLQIVTHQLFLEASGASEIEAQGKAEYLQAEMNGASELNAKKLITQQADLTANWASEIEITAIQVLSQKASRASEIKINN